MFRQMNVRRILITALRFINQLTHTRIQQQSKEDAHIFSTQHISCQFRNVENVLYLYDAKNYFLYFFLANFVFAMKFMKKYAYFSQKYPDLFSEKIPVIYEGISRIL